MVKKKWLIGGVALAVLGGGYLVQQNYAQSDKSLSIAAAGAPITLDPTSFTDVNSSRVALQSQEALYSFDVAGNIVPGIAKRVVEPTQNGTVYTFDLREDAKWSNGEPIVAQDFITAIERQADPKFGSQATKNYTDILNFDEILAGKKEASELGIKALSDHQLQVTLKQPSPYIDYLFAANYYPIATQQAKKWGKTYGTTAEKTLYSGAYTVAGWNGNNNKWTYHKNTHYWNSDEVAQIETVKVQAAEDKNTSQLLFARGDVQEAPVNGLYVKNNQDNPELYTVLDVSTQAMWFNNTDERLNNAHLRKAITAVIDGEELVNNVIADGSQVATGWVPAGDQTNASTGNDFAQEAGTLVQQDLSLAKKEWEAYLTQTGQKTLEISLTSKNEAPSADIALYIKKVAEENLTGLTINIKRVTGQQAIDDALKQNYDLLFMGWATGYPDASDYLNLLETNNSLNWSRFSDKNYDKLIQRVTESVNEPEKRWQYMQEAQRYLLEEAAALTPLYQPAKSYLISDKVAGIEWHPFIGSQYKYATWK